MKCTSFSVLQIKKHVAIATKTKVAERNSQDIFREYHLHIPFIITSNCGGCVTF